jgi:hypothetical protein
MFRFLLLARTAGLFLLVAFGVRAVLTTQVVRLDTNPASRQSGRPGTVSLTAPGGTADGVSFHTPGLVPGATAASAVDLVMSTSSGRRMVTLTTTASSSSLLDQDPVDGLQLAVDRCAVPWVGVRAADHAAYRCPGRRISVLAPRPVLVRNIPLPNLDVTGGSRQHLLLSLTLPQSAGNEFQGLSSTIHYALSAE